LIDNNIGSEGATHLSKALKLNTTLTSLNLNGMLNGPTYMNVISFLIIVFLVKQPIW